jgi:sporadic carbohydrate cluster protein (TIGR04323 family)
MSKKTVRGYIFSRPFFGERAPQHIQNIVIRNYCYSNNLEYLLSASEYKFIDSYFMLNQIIDELDIIDGIVAYSIFQMPTDQLLREKIMKKVLKQNKQFYFALEDFIVSDSNDLNTFEEIWKVKQVLPNCYRPN